MDERHSKEFWKENSTLSIVGQFIDDLRANITGKSCPNYFVPNNLMMGAYTDQQVNSLLSKLDDISTDMYGGLYVTCIYHLFNPFHFNRNSHVRSHNSRISHVSSHNWRISHVTSHN